MLPPGSEFFSDRLSGLGWVGARFSRARKQRQPATPHLAAAGAEAHTLLTCWHPKRPQKEKENARKVYPPPRC